MKLRFIYLLTALMAMMSLTSCHNDDSFGNGGGSMLPIYYINAKKTTNFVAVKEKGETDWKYYSGADVLMIFDMNDNTCSFSVSEMEFDTDRRATMSVAGIPMTDYRDSAVKGCQGAGPYETATASTELLQITNVRIKALLDPERTFGTDGVDEQGNPKPKQVGAQVAFSFTINGEYDVQVIPNKHYFYGTTISTNPSHDFATFSTTKSKYEMALNSTTGKAQLSIENALFVDGMPEGINMTFPGIDFKVTDLGIEFESESLIPQLPQTPPRPMPAYKVSPFHATILTGELMNMNFTCPAIPIPANQTQNTYEFQVSARLPYSLTAPAY